MDVPPGNDSFFELTRIARETAAQPAPRSAASTAASGPAPAGPHPFQPFGEDGLTFFDVLDAINPLQHLPLVSTLYRELTGDALAPVPRVVGGALFGGLIGAVSSLLNVIVEQLTGRDVGAHVLAAVEDVTGGGDAPATAEAGGAIAAASPVVGNIEVLRWAERENAYRTALAADQLPAVGGKYPYLPLRARADAGGPHRLDLLS